MEPTDKFEVKVPVDEDTPYGTGGVRAYWRVNAGSMTRSKPNTQRRSVPLEELYAFVEADAELRDDGARLSARLTDRSARAIRWELGNAAMFGDGVGKPLGAWNASQPGLVVVAKEDGQTASTIVVANLLNMLARFIEVESDVPVWYYHPSCLPQLMTMTIGDQPMWVNGDATRGIPPTLFGYPAIKEHRCQPLGSQGDILLGSPMGWYGARRGGEGDGGIEFASSMHLLFDYNAMAFRWTIRAGGQPYLSAPVAPMNGSATLSHFLALAERA